MLTILQCLYDFWIARHALNRPIKWRNEKFILGVLAETANIIPIQVELGNEDSAVLLRYTVEFTISDKKTLFFLKERKMSKRDLCEFLPIQLNYSTELPQCNLQYCSIINAIRVVLLLSWLRGHLSIPESRKKREKRTQISQMSDLIERKQRKNFEWHNFNFHSFFPFSCYTHTHTQYSEVDAAVIEGRYGIEWWVYYGGYVTLNWIFLRLLKEIFYHGFGGIIIVD